MAKDNIIQYLQLLKMAQLEYQKCIGLNLSESGFYGAQNEAYKTIY